jgi:hypothetical protein
MARSSRSANDASGQAGKSGQLAAFIQQRIRDTYRRQRPAPLPCRTAKSRHQSQLGVDWSTVTHDADHVRVDLSSYVLITRLLPDYQLNIS